MKLEFRKLRADEIEARIGQIYKNDTGLSLLLYKDARCDMNLLDEVVGAMNWTREHKEVKGAMYAGVGIRNEATGEWVYKWDCGTESNTEAKKGEASDSFKRACTNWGIGRELYTAPQIQFWARDVDIQSGRCYEKFIVTEIEYNGANISHLVVVAEKSKARFEWNAGEAPKPPKTAKEVIAENEEKNKTASKKINQDEFAFLNKTLQKAGYTAQKVDALKEHYEVKELKQLNRVQFEAIISKLEGEINGKQGRVA